MIPQTAGTLATGGAGRAFPGTSAQDAGEGYLVPSTGHTSHCLNAGGMGRQDYETETLIALTAKGKGFDASKDGPVPQDVAVAFTVSGPSGGFAWEKPYASAVMATRPSDTANTQTGVRIGSAVRRLTPRECERLQGFPDDYTVVPHRGKPAADGPRYKALGNSMAVPCMAWIGQRIAAVDALLINQAVAA